MKKICTFAGLLCVSVSMYAQSIKISGVVTDEMGPVMGASVMVKGTKTGTVTDVNGRYTLSADKNDVLVFSYVGTNPVEKTVTGAVLDVNLTSNVQSINEVVVTAIGIKQEKKKLGYTTQQVEGADIAAAGNLNAGASLQGEVAGLTVSVPSGMFQSPTFSLRGKTPLIVLDGVPIESDLFDLSSENIASVNVLKGTAASALYGARGRNGAIMITTKRAEKEGIEINFSTKDMVQAGYMAFPETQHEFGSGSQGKYAFWDGEGGGISDDDMQWGPRLDVGNVAPQWNSPIRDKVTGETIPWWGSVTGTQYDDQGRYERVATPLVSHDNIGDFLETGIITNNTLSLSYKGDKARVYVLGQYAYQKGQAPTTSLQNGGLNINTSFDISDKLTLDAMLNYNMVYSPNYPDYGYHPSNYMYNIIEWMGDDVDGRDLEQHLWVPGMEGYRQASYNYAWYNNPYFAITQSKRKQRRNVLTGQLRLNYQILPELSVMGRVSMRSNRNLTEHETPKSYMNYSDSREGGYKVWNETQDNVDADVLVTYTKSFMSDINLTVNAGSPLPQRLRVDRRAQCARRLLAEQLYRQHHNLRRRQPSVGFAQREGDKECLRLGKHRPLEVRIPLCNRTQRLVVDHCHGQQLVFLSFCGRQLGDIRLCEAAQVYGLPEGDGVVGNGQQRPRPVPDTAGLHQGEQLGEHAHHQLSVGTGQL